MWNKREEESVRPASVPQQAVSVVTASASAVRRELAAIGPSISIVGDITGDEDLTIHGKVKGKIDLPRHDVTVGESGKVDADVHAKVVSVAGEVRGNLFAGEQILIRKSATMLGNLTAPRVGLEDGCCFRGSVDMEAQEKTRTASSPTPRAPGVIQPVNPGGVLTKPETPPVRP